MCKDSFIFGPYADYPWNRLSTVPVPPNSTDDREFTVYENSNML